MIQRLAQCVVLSAAMTVPALTSAQQTAGPAAAEVQMQGQFERAVTDFAEHRYTTAYGRLAQLADQGHRDAAHLALHMYRYSGALYGAAWQASTEQQRAWSSLVVDDLRAPVQRPTPGQASRPADDEPDLTYEFGRYGS